MRVLILGASGLLGFSIYSILEKNKKVKVFGTFRNLKKKNKFYSKQIIHCENLSNYNELKTIILNIKPNYIINCISSKDTKDLKKNIQCYYYVNKNIFFPELEQFNKEEFYYIHSYACKPKNKEDIIALSSFKDQQFCSIVANKPNIIGMQFHPEKSSKVGLELLENIIKKF